MTILMLLENDFLRDFRVLKEVQTLFEAGHKIVVAAITTSGSDFEYREVTTNCTVYRKPMPLFINKSSVGALRLPFYFSFWRKYVKELINKEKVDAIHVHDLPLSAVGLEFKKKQGIKFVVDLHENWPALLSVSKHTNTFLGRRLSSDRQWRAYEKNCAQSADAIITVVQEMKERIVALGVDPGKIFILENTPTIGCLKPPEKKPVNDYFALTYIGGITYHRGLQYVIRGIKLLVGKMPIKLYVVGDGSFLTELKKLVNEYQLHDSVEFTGRLEKSAAESFLNNSDVALIPHIRSEQSDNSSPNKLFEYMCAGVPVLASDCPSLKRVIDETQTGGTYVYDSPSDFAEKVISFYNNPDSLATFRLNGRKAIETKYNWEKSATSIIELYSQTDN